MSTAPATQPQAKALTPYQQVEKTLTSPNTLDSLRKMLPPHITVERFQRAALVALQRTPDLANVERESLYLAINAAAQDGLIPDGKECVIVPMKGKAVYWRMVAGLMKKARNSGEILTIMAETVHKNDVFEYWTDEKGRHLKHHPNMMTDRGAMIGAYAMAQTKDGGCYMEVMSKAQIDKRKNVSRASGNGPWVDWYEEQSKKTVVKALCGYLPSSTDILGMPTPEVEDEGGEPLPVESFKPAGGDAEPKEPKPSGAGSKTQAAVLGQVPPVAPAAAPQGQIVDEKPSDGQLPI